MNMAKTQDLPLNPSKVSGVCGRLLCCLSYENEQYKQMKATMPRLGQPIETPAGPGMVVAMQILKDLVTVRLAADNTDHHFTAADLGLRREEPKATPPKPVVPLIVDNASDEPNRDEDEETTEAVAGAEPASSVLRKRRRRGRGGRRGGGQPRPQA